MKLLMMLTKFILKRVYRVQISGLEHLSDSDKPTLIIANHTSFLDAVLLGLFLPTNISFAIHSSYYQKWWLSPIKKIIALFPVDHTDPMAMKSLIKHVRKGNKVVIFPEGRITATGSLMKIYSGPGMVADKANAEILPIRIDGAQYTPFSRLKGQVRIRWFPQIKLTILKPQTLQFEDGTSGRERRQQAGKILYSIMQEMVFETSPYKQRLWDNLIEAAHIHGEKHQILEDIDRQSMSYRQLFTRSMVLQQLFPKAVKRNEHIGLLLPNMTSCVVTFFALQAKGAVPCMLNYTMGENATRIAIESTNLKTVLTSRRFIEAADLGTLITSMEQHTNIIYLEDLREKLNIFHKIKGLLMVKLPFLGINRLIRHVQPTDTAVILFTSGSEGIPKSVVLSHQNILANIEQVCSSIAFTTRDICLNALPMFHSFGLMVGTLLTTLKGVKTFLYPSPLHYRVIPEVAYDINATILFGTNVFLAGYAKHAHPYDFYSMRYVIAGAEKLQQETRNLWIHKFGIRIFEGYGATETSPVLAVNTPMHYKEGTVGRLLPGIQHKLEHVPGIEAGGRLFVKGANIMSGYLLHEFPNQIQAPEDGWYDTGDIVSVDQEGFVSIQGRAKRFAKVAGEMVSLTAVEEMCSQCWPDFEHVAFSFPDPSKGERLVLMSTLHKPERSELLTYAKTHGLNDLQVPRVFLYVSEVPLMRTGKVHFTAAQALAEEMLVSQS
ncbi:MAG: AMP-binding protein [Ghiorsea sp.]